MPIIYQDSTSVISLITKGGGITQTKHLRARMNLGKEVVDENKVLIIYKRSGKMKADGFSKLFDCVDHKPFAKMVQGYQTTGGC